MTRRFAIVFILFFTVLPATAQQPLPRVPDGFKVEPVLQAPEIEAPTALAVAPNGDVYFAEDPMDMTGPPTQNRDRIWLLKGGDPKKKILFADKMWAVMGLEVVRDKLYCVHAPYVTVFTLDPEGKAAKREDLFTDLGPKVAGLPGFNDHIASGIRMGMDGWLYVSIGDKGIPKMTRKEKDAGSEHVAEGRWRRTKEGNHISLEGGGVIRFRPDGSRLEVFASGTRNHLDVPLDEHDRIFVRDNTDDGDGWNTRLMYLPPGAFMGYPWAFKKHPNETLPAIHDFGGGSPCGGWVYTDDGLPETYRGRIFHCEWGKGRVLAVKVKPKGAGFEFVDEISFMDADRGGLKDFRPFTLRPTTDGRGFYVTDWGHSGWLAKVKAGRIWKVTYTGDDVKPAARGKDTDSVEELIKALGHPAHGERLRAQRELTARGEEAVANLLDLFEENKLTPLAQRHALWVGANRNERWLRSALRRVPSADRSLGLEAVRVLLSHPPEDPEQRKQIDRSLAAVTAIGPDPQVRMQAAWGATWDAGTTAVMFETERDEWVRAALVRSIKAKPSGKFVIDFYDAARVRSSPAASLEGVLLACAGEYHGAPLGVLQDAALKGPLEIRRWAVALLARVYKERKPYGGGWWGTRPEQQQPPARVVEWPGTKTVRLTVLQALRDEDTEVRSAAVAGLLAMNDPETFEPLTRRFSEEVLDDTRTTIVRVVAGLKNAKTTEFLSSVLRGGKHSDAVRLEAIPGLERAATPEAIQALRMTITEPGPIALRVRSLEAIGAAKGVVARDAVIASLKSPEPPLRRAAAGTLGQLGGKDAGDFLLPLLDDADPAVRIAAIRSLGETQAKATVPALVRAAGVEATQFDATTALTRIPDKRALTVYLAGLGSKNQPLRQACREAIAAIRDEVTPALEELVKRNEVPAALLPELRTIFTSFMPLIDWHLIGPFPSDGKAHPPETEQKFDAAYKGTGKEIKWRLNHKADAKQQGRVNLKPLFQPNDNVVVYGYAEFESATARETQLQIGSDDTIVVWLNGKTVHAFDGNRGWAPNQDTVRVRLDAGKNRLLVKCGNASGPWDFSVAVGTDPARYAFLQGGAKKFDLEEFRAFARKTDGDAERGRKLFQDVKGLACAKCHAVGGEGGKVGPDLAGVALKYQREELMTAILEPSKQIANGYETLVLQLTSGKTLQGVFKGESNDALHLMDADGKATAVPKKDVEERATSPVSTMPNGLGDGMTLRDFADLIAYLEARRETSAPPRK